MHRRHSLVYGKRSSRVFEVEIEREKSVAFLKEIVKEKKKPQFDYISANRLDIWQVEHLGTRS
jgi:hypothetical protein